MKLIFDNVTVEDAKELLSCVDINVEHLKFTEESANSLQQLKAEIAAIADSVEDYTTTGADAGTVACIVRDLRQLSAV